jgi:hypothetical protein
LNFFLFSINYKKEQMVCFLLTLKMEGNLLGGLMKKEKTDLTGFNEIKIITTGYTRPGAQNAEIEVNRLLRERWILLETYTTCYSNTPPLSSQQEVHFVLGKKEVVRPEQTANALQA